jgi:peptidoglycan/LPS O-acetylase OafA/YrhL
MPGHPEPFALGYRPALDSLRAIAVCAVLAYHVGWIRGGWLGVDVFFTLSGFLITTLLLGEHARTGTISIRRFYVRRARRLLPALGLFLLVWVPVSLASMPRSGWPVFVAHVAGVVGYVTNWLILYWWMAPPFGHLWSLAIEEQFYLCWPVLLFALLRLLRPRWLLPGFVTAAAVSVAWRTWLTWGVGAAPRRLYLGTDTHADGLLLGAALAVWCVLRPWTGRPSCPPWLGLGSALLLLAMLLAAPLNPGYLWSVTVLGAVATGGVLLDVVRGGSWLTRGLETTWLVRIGWISYGVYLWHFPVFLNAGVLRHSGETPAPLGRSLLAWAVTVAIAGLSYWLVERPCLASKASRLSIHRENEPPPGTLVPRATENGAPALPVTLPR